MLGKRPKEALWCILQKTTLLDESLKEEIIATVASFTFGSQDRRAVAQHPAPVQHFPWEVSVLGV